MSPLFRKKPVVIEAMLIAAECSDEDFLDPNTRAIAEVSGWMLGNGFHDFKVHGDGGRPFGRGRRPFGIAITTLEGIMIASPGDWIIRGIQGEFYPCKPDIFEATYEPAS